MLAECVALFGTRIHQLAEHLQMLVTDRIELDDQIAKTFKAAGAVSEVEAEECHAQSGAVLRGLLRGNHRYVFTLIHKFQSAEVLSDRRDVIVLTDEAHRSQYDTLALNMRSALPRALFLAFTGTPLIAGEERTREVFGDYVSIYDFEQSVEDGATVPLYYENRTPELRLENPRLNEEIYDLVEAAQLDERQEDQLARRLGRQYHLITRDDRLEAIARDVVGHFLGRGFQGKAMMVSIDKATALRMHDKVRRHWEAERARAEREIARHYPKDALTDEFAELSRRLEVLRTTDMALVVSSEQNEIARNARAGSRHRAAPDADERGTAGREVQGPRRPGPSGLRLRHVADRLRRTELLDDLSRQADAEPDAHADHRPGQPGVSGQAQRPHRGLRQRLCVAGKGTVHLWPRSGRDHTRAP